MTFNEKHLVEDYTSNALEKRDCDAALFKSTQVRDFILVGTIKVDEDEN